MPTEAQNRATAKYKKAHYIGVHLNFKPEEIQDIDKYLAITGEPRATFIKRIAVDAARSALAALDTPPDPDSDAPSDNDPN